VTLTDGLGGRKDVLLGQYGTKASRVEYARVIAEWEAAGRSLMRTVADVSDLSINELALAYWNHAERYYGFTAERGDKGCFKSVLRLLRETYGHNQADAFGRRRRRIIRVEKR
jgi:hypothetical protein